VVVPFVEEEDAKRPHREREFLVQERVRIENRIAALLATQGVRERPSLRSWDADMRALRTGDGRPLPTHLLAELNRRRLSLTLEMIRELDVVREQALEAQHDSASRTVKALCTIRGIGVNFASVLTREVFYRTFDNRRQIASYLGLAPTPFQSGGMDRDRRINRAGNSRARERSSNSPGFGFATNQRAALRHGSGTVLARFRVESAASQSSPWRASA
jgi:transposase